MYKVEEKKAGKNKSRQIIVKLSKYNVRKQIFSKKTRKKQKQTNEIIT